MIFKSKYSIIFSAFLFFSLQVLNAQDWANLNRFKKQNEALGIPVKGENRVVFMGNSITEGWKVSDPELFSNNSFINRGIGGQTTPQMLVRFRQDVINLKPEVVVILAGTNDIAGNTGPMTLEEIRDNIASMAELARSNGISVVISSVLPAYDYPWRPGLEPNIKIPKLNKMLKYYAGAKGMVYLDYFSVMADDRNGLPKVLAEDGVHPTKKGYDIMKPLVLDAIKTSLKTKF
ncbi:SGNH/GDSL hydrolase family protein [Lutimonas saemankumensis]|uniref:SGNH/GDSL hydrolase family protein n=1 Tax=Lutimonas saemankumensis TaxID=483016 RepID=UPI001CD39518|nr:SGNH/GDSL hydrolase family protein [Lutimonas saemankumensis]MCA0932957.1 SGNH/GDSL hydrolase family protein [Lutimonas saemankumensis]